MKIGFFDSGLGGLLILKSVSVALPDYDYEFYGDTANLPYGDRDENEIYELTKQGVKYLFERNCLIVILACNTASAETLRRLQDNFVKDEFPERRVLGVVIPTVEEVVDKRVSNLLLLATRRTIESCKYNRELEKLKSRTIINACATPELVPLIEGGHLDKAFEIMQSRIEEGEGIDSVILGCTHYSLLKQRLRETYPDLQFLSQDEIIPKKLKYYLSRHPEMEKRLTREMKREVFLTKAEGRYASLLSELLGD